jgi:DNA-binding LytR/AlgR family response regulator
MRAGRLFLLLDNGVEVPVSRRFKKVVRERFG